MGNVDRRALTSRLESGSPAPRRVGVIGSVLFLCAALLPLVQAQPALSAPAATLPVPSGFDPGGPWMSPDGSTLFALNRWANSTTSSLVALRPDGSVKWRRDDFRGPVVDISFSPDGAPIVAMDDREYNMGGYRPSLAVLTSTGETLRATNIGNEDMTPWDVEYGGDGYIYLHAALNRYVVQSYRFNDLGLVDEYNLGSVGQLAARKGMLTYVDWNGSSRHFSYNDGRLDQSIHVAPPTYGTLQRTSVDPNGHVFLLNLSSGTETYNCNNVTLSFQGRDVASWARRVSDYLPGVSSSGCEAFDVEALPTGGATLGVLLPSQEVVLLRVAPNGELERTINRTLGVGGTVGAEQRTIPRHLELQAGGAGNMVFAGIGLEPCNRPGQTWACGFLRLETIAPDGTSLALEELHGDRGSDSSTDDSVKLYDRTAMESESLGVGKGVGGLFLGEGDFYAGTGGFFGSTERFVLFPAPVERRYWEDPPTDSTTTTQAAPAFTRLTPVDMSRFDLVPGATKEFTIAAADPDGATPELLFSFYQPSGQSRTMPDFIDCSSPTRQPGRVTQSCTVRPIANVLAIMQVVATDGTGKRSEARRFLIGASQYKYIALGDSYSAGEGVDPYFRDGYHDTGSQTGTVDNRCHRSSRAFATSVRLPGETTSIYAQASGLGDTGSGRGTINKYGSDANTRLSRSKAWGIFACSGAVMDNVLPASEGGQVPAFSGGYREKSTQLDYSFVDYTTDVVTITIGGNDVMFANVLRDCMLSRQSCSSAEKRSQVESSISELRPELIKLYRSIRAKTFNARVIVLGYPKLFPQTGSFDQLCGGDFAGFRGEGDYLNDMSALLNETISTAASEAGVEFASVDEAFKGHEVCTRQIYLNGPSFTNKLPQPGSWFRMDDESFHPNLAGHSAYARVVNECLASLSAGQNCD